MNLHLNNNFIWIESYSNCFQLINLVLLHIFLDNVVTIKSEYEGLYEL